MRARTGLAAAAVVAALLTPFVCVATELQQKKTPAKPAAAPSGKSGEAPVTVEFLGLAADKESVRYRIHVNTDKPLEQVDLGLTYTGTDGKRHTETLIWQNIVKSRRQPIEKGKVYEDERYLAPGPTAVDCKLLRVVYKDMTTWAPAK